ncbi:MAG: hypothetical protein Q4B70_13150 [Lachnospiraceae bacterium]|nr:hypothetical protein [Lachnospiraceae bacterium]
MKRNSKKILALLLTAIMVMAMGITSFAAEKSVKTAPTVNVVFMVHSSSGQTVATQRKDNITLAENATVKDAIETAASSLNITTNWAEDTYSDPSGWYITSCWNLSSQYIDSGTTEDGNSFYESNDWILYQISNSDKLEVSENPYTSSQALSLYASNVSAINGNTIYVVYQKTYSEW